MKANDYIAMLQGIVKNEGNIDVKTLTAMGNNVIDAYKPRLQAIGTHPKGGLKQVEFNDNETYNNVRVVIII